MIKSFIHKGLQKFYASGNTSGIQKKHEKKLRLILTNLDQAESPDDMDLPGLFMPPLKGERSGIWSVRISGNWRITYRFDGRDVEIVNYEDYH
ncbi:type II toxin-antitoxin system RelE/ParE family toxin [Thiomicrospira microaerophila]|uniref:type II toxin-antitoxin system RelE/ParE family toxin n=1 Tax=Thiomicrospira microaerophila TaxID=406020 RepID=UPI00200CE4F2|nr:type II toxin-antitoxin system RelE/ParE family toxin [Thiomicrospira microaerophila]UQB41560.1 type II toxin-antitoxin system RelE/ParE family toxin [Thiomicrospira microaerophila]